ncbi:amino acid adenylation domain-containing protein [Streptomyces parvulus]|uniref:amino acid adenylation domain-containing protein n=1 Tax=Streptomyces parvulus TaxID=146923 RepID=UPI003811FD42
MVEAQTNRRPSAVAAQGQRNYSYQELVERAESLADAVTRQVPRGSLVALDTSSPVNGAIGFLAAARSDCAVLPLNTESPEAHRKGIIADSRPSLVLSADEEGEFALDRSELTRASATTAPMNNVAYVMYTSGSTGKPKGVMVPHEALLSRMWALSQMPGLATDESIVAMTALSFDISIAEILLPLTVGARFVAATPEARIDPDVFSDFVDRHRPNVLQATPSFWRLVLAGGWHGSRESRIWCGGEAMTSHLAKKLRPVCKELWNLYGPTEATIWATAARIESEDTIFLGSALPGANVCLKDGEILLYGKGLALGYMGQTEQTAKRFCHMETPDGTQLVYRTGDRAQLTTSGNLEFLGRMDGQIKLRGHRIELGEIEAILEEHHAVSEAVALLANSDHPDRAFISAFAVAAPGTRENELRQWMRSQLPASHCPTRFSLLPALPRTTAGKVDRVRLSTLGT